MSLALDFNSSSTGSDGDLSTSHTANTGQTWVLPTGASDLVYAQIGHKVYLNTTGLVGRSVLSVSPPSPDYSIEADIGFTDSASSSQGLTLRDDGAGSPTHYLLTNDVSSSPGNTIWQLYKGISGSYTQLGTYTTTTVSSQHAKLTAVGSTITATIDGTDRIVVTDTSISVTGNPGLRFTSGTVDAGRAITNLAVNDETPGGTSVPFYYALTQGLL